MTRHKLNRNAFRLDDGSEVTIEYWMTEVTYQAQVDPAQELTIPLQTALIASLANALEYALIRKPELLIRKR